MRKIWFTLVAVILTISLSLPTQIQAAAAKTISIYIDGQKLYTDQDPVMVKDRTMLPMRAIFEALDATVDWNGKTSTVTATKGNSRVVLKIGSKTATINNETVTLDVPAQNLKGRTMVPVRFVSEALGQEVNWNSATKTVNIITTGAVYAVSYVSARAVANQGNGSDLEVSFPKAQQESRASEYRIFVVKAANAYNFNLSQATANSNYTYVRPSGVDVSVRLSSSTKDVNGELLRSNQPYAVFVLTVGKGGYTALSSASSTVTLSQNVAIGTPANVTVRDVSDYGDGRDLSVSFTKPQNDSNISSYRIFVVKTKDTGSFNYTTANAVASGRYTTVGKTASSQGITLASSSRDTSGDYIRNGIPYTVYVLAVSSNGGTSPAQLSSGSSSITLGSGSVTVPVITGVSDVSNYGDGRDLRVSFTKVSDESQISSYRIFVVKNSKAYNFDLADAKALSSSYYTVVNKTGYNISQTLYSGARDVDGSLIQNGVSYRVFVMAVGSGYNSGNDTLSSSSSAITLSGYSGNPGNNYSVGAASNVRVSDEGDYGDGRDLLVTFTRADDEYNISHYRIMVVKASDAPYFDLSDANSVSSSRYTYVDKAGYTVSKRLASGARDVDGDLIRNGVNYRVFVLSVASGNSYSNNALSYYSPSITLTGSYNVYPATGVSVKDVSDFNDGRDMEVSFNKAADETNMNDYRIMVVKAAQAGSFDLSKAVAVNSSNYTKVAKQGKNITKRLDAQATDVNGDKIQNGIGYRVYVLAVGSGYASGTYKLSDPSGVITLSGVYSVAPVQNVHAEDIGNLNNGKDLQVSFTKPDDDEHIDHYNIMVVKAGEADSFNLAAANAVKGSNYVFVNNIKGKDYTSALPEDARDVSGKEIKNGGKYKVFVLSVADQGSGYLNMLSDASDVVELADTSLPVVTKIKAADQQNGVIEITFEKPKDEKGIDHYKVLVVPSKKQISLKDANQLKDKMYLKVDKKDSKAALDLLDKNVILDVFGNKLELGKNYKFYILSVAASKSGLDNSLSAASEEIQVKLPYDGLVEFDKDAASKYVKDQYVRYKNLIYQAKVDAPTGEPDSSEDYTVVKK